MSGHGGVGSGRRVIFKDTTRHSKRVVQAVRLGRPETVYKKVLSEAEQAEQLGARHLSAREAKRRRIQKRLDDLEKCDARLSTVDHKSILKIQTEGTRNLTAELAGLLAARKEGGGERERPVTYDGELQAAAEFADTQGSGSGREKRNRWATNKEHWTPAVKKILTTKRTIGSLMTDAAEFPSMYVSPNYFTAQAPPPTQRVQAMCSVCGYWGHYACVRCGDRYCSRKCGST
ncbi:hypothetical protein OC845_002822 [Tilletia horrida]|nr:hypothetical protein OC845_002822 [Tilletia horrida]